ncbi:hypothetical protein A1O3_10089 [Capronia epimyces CBS 606.96]|uniref:Uncharacterized protein n=1 Tax=Capronia epimyces CBS 606.96 TaxID=1182542 RepID=W9X8Z4_9EURO|nr:uncharacterized protein A1O3_10089 [Capronia epimyces CBS 606.96]EXJ76932.1 hypothetical protein A1O3_10089 [Capronia epimyces CBS 606.96]
MAFRASDESRYPMLSNRRSEDEEEDEFEDQDIEDHRSDVSKGSSTTLYEITGLKQKQKPSSISSRASQKDRLTWIRWAAMVVLQSLIILLLLGRDMWPSRGERDRETDPVLKGKVVETGGDINGLYKTVSHTYTFLKPEAEKFIPNMTTNEDRMTVRRNWDLLMPLGSGSVAIPEYRDHPLLGDPITDDPIRSGPIFEASWTHALHCLYYSVDSYHQLIVNGRSDFDNPVHATHCFEYLRNSILCNLDMTLEGSMSTPADKDKGQPHVCRNRQEAIDWIEARRLDDLQDIVGP